MAVVFSVAAVVATVVPHDTGAWLPLHLFLVGGLLSAISTTTQMLAVTWSSSPAPPPVVAAAQRWCLAAGTVALVAGREAEVRALVEWGGLAVVVAVVAMVPILLAIRRHAVTDRFTPAIDAYVTALAAGAAGTSIAVVLGTGRAGDRAVELRDTHLTVNLLGLVGLVVAGTLPFFAATQVRSKMSPRATPLVMRATTALLATSVATAGLGQFLGRPGLAAVGLFAYGAGLVVIAALLPIYGRRQRSWAGPRLVQLGAGLAWWTATTIVFAVVVLTERDDRPVLRAMVIGGFAQILMASLAYLGPVLRGGGHERLTAGFAITRSWPALVAGNVAAIGALVDHRGLMTAGLAIWFADAVIRAVRLVLGSASAGATVP
ncbi:MAG: hypothetical protein AB7Q42_02805 [Acidimicrobiia bacterium]